MGNRKITSCLLVGKPNCGKSSLFNQLTGLNQKIGNFSGVTVAQKKGTFDNIEIIDLPGLESFKATTPEAFISKQHILKANNIKQPIIFVANGMQMYSSLMLFSQIADLQIPTIFVVNFKDEIEKSNIRIDVKALKNRLGCEIVLANSRNGDGIDELKSLISENKFFMPNAFNRSHYDILEGNVVKNNYKNVLDENKELSTWKEDHKKRKKIISELLNSTFIIPADTPYFEQTSKIDKVLLHPILGLLIFLGVLYLVFQAVFYLSGFPMDWIDNGMLMLSQFLGGKISTPWLNDIITNAIIPGITGVIIFIPQIAILFLLIGILEQIGYMSRISFIADNFLRKFGLSGHSVIPLVSSWACAIPAIMSTRIIENPKERFAVIMASPLMTCSARLPVYTILITILFPTDKSLFLNYRGLALLALYLLGVISTLFVAYVVSKYSKQKSTNNWVLELPIFRMPAWKNLGINVYNKTNSFVVQAGKIIFTISILLWFLASFSPKNEAYIETYAQEHDVSLSSAELEYSYLGYAGKLIEPVIKPLGYDWKIGIALISSFAAREVFVGTLSTIYSIESEDEKSITQRLMQETDNDGNKVFTVATSLSLLLFYVFAMQCMSTLAIVVKETGSWKYAVYQFLGMTTLAYLASFICYQVLK